MGVYNSSISNSYKGVIMEPQATASPAPTNATSTWPGAFGVFKQSKAVVLFNAMPIIVLLIVSTLLNVLTPDNALASLVAFVITCIVSVALTWTILEAQKGTKIGLGAAIEKGFSLLAVKYFALSIVMGFMLVGSLLLFIIPFFFVLPRILFAPYVLVETDGEIIDSIKKSWALTKGNAGKAWGVIGVTLLFALLIVVLVGIYLSIMYVAATVLLYAFMKTQQGMAGPTVAAPQNPVLPTPPAVPPAPVQ